MQLNLGELLQSLLSDFLPVGKGGSHSQIDIPPQQSFQQLLQGTQEAIQSAQPDIPLALTIKQLKPVHGLPMEPQDFKPLSLETPETTEVKKPYFLTEFQRPGTGEFHEEAGISMAQEPGDPTQILLPAPPTFLPSATLSEEVGESVPLPINEAHIPDDGEFAELDLTQIEDWGSAADGFLDETALSSRSNELPALKQVMPGASSEPETHKRAFNLGALHEPLNNKFSNLKQVTSASWFEPETGKPASNPVLEEAVLYRQLKKFNHLDRAVPASSPGPETGKFVSNPVPRSALPAESNNPPGLNITTQNSLPGTEGGEPAPATMSEESALPQQSNKPSALNRMTHVSGLAPEIGPDASPSPEEVATPMRSDKISDLKVATQALHPGAESGKPASDFVTPANAASMLNGEEAPAQQVSQVTETAVKQTAETDGMPMQSSPVPNRQVSPSEKGNFLSLERPLGGQGWAEELGERLLWMQNKSVHVAELRLNPAHLGPVEVKIQVNQEETLVHFTAQHAPAREAIDAALPRLREMFNAQQLSLAQVEVSSHNGSDQKQPHQEQHHSSASRWPNWSEEGGDFAREKEERRLSQGHRLLNIYV